MPAGISRRAYLLRLRSVWIFLPVFYWLAQPTLRTLLLGGGVAVLGLALRGWAAAHLRKAARLCVFGPYAHLRNPLFAGSFLIALGVIAAGGRPVFLVPLVLYFAGIYPWHVEREVETLERAHGDAYRRYREAVPAVVPRVLPYRDPSRPAPEPAVPPPAGPRPLNRRGRPEPPPFECYRAPSLALYLRHREWEALLGTLGALGLLVGKAYFL